MDTWLKIADAPSSAGVLQRIGSSSAHRAAGIFPSQLVLSPVSARLIEARSEERPPRGRIVPLRGGRCAPFFVPDWFVCLACVCLNVMHGTAARSGAG